MQPLDQNAVDFLRAITRPPHNETPIAVAHLAKKVNHWDDVIEGARRHRILPIFYRRLVDITDIVPPPLVQQAKSEFERNAFHCLTNAEELLHILSAFEAAGIAAMPFKGVILAASAYGDMTLRMAGDIDLLIRYRDLQRGRKALNAADSQPARAGVILQG